MNVDIEGLVDLTMDLDRVSTCAGSVNGSPLGPDSPINPESDDETSQLPTWQSRGRRHYFTVPPLAEYTSFQADLESTLHAVSKANGYELVQVRAKRIYPGGPKRKQYYACKRHGTLGNKRRLTNDDRVRKSRSSIKTNCQFALVGTASLHDGDSANPEQGPWQLSSGGTDYHNHEADDKLQLSGHRRQNRTDNVKAMIISLYTSCITPAKILEVLWKQFGSLSVILQDVKNVIAYNRVERLTKTVTSTTTSTSTAGSDDLEDEEITYTIRQSSTTVLFQRFEEIQTIH